MCWRIKNTLFLERHDICLKHWIYNHFDRKIGIYTEDRWEISYFLKSIDYTYYWWRKLNGSIIANSTFTFHLTWRISSCFIVCLSNRKLYVLIDITIMHHQIVINIGCFQTMLDKTLSFEFMSMLEMNGTNDPM